MKVYMYNVQQYKMKVCIRCSLNKKGTCENTFYCAFYQTYYLKNKHS